jgi:hypothetical protein
MPPPVTALPPSPTRPAAAHQVGGCSMLAKLYWRRFRCADCGQLFELPRDDTTLPRHARAGEDCPGCDAVPA